MKIKEFRSAAQEVSKPSFLKKIIASTALAATLLGSTNAMAASYDDPYLYIDRDYRYSISYTPAAVALFPGYAFVLDTRHRWHRRPYVYGMAILADGLYDPYFGFVIPFVRGLVVLFGIGGVPYSVVYKERIVINNRVIVPHTTYHIHQTPNHFIITPPKPAVPTLPPAIRDYRQNRFNRQHYNSLSIPRFAHREQKINRHRLTDPRYQQYNQRIPKPR